MHSYSTNESKITTFGQIGLAAALAAIGFHFTIEWLVNALGWSSYSENYGWLVSPISMSGIFALFFRLYDSRLWKRSFWKLRLSSSPDLNGTYVGYCKPHDRPVPQLTVMWIFQTWSEISIAVDGFTKSSVGTVWKRSDVGKRERLGRDRSIAAMINKSGDSMLLTTTYRHTGEKEDQPNFMGTYELSFRGTSLEGNYFTGKGRGSHGHLSLNRISASLLSDEAAIATELQRLSSSHPVPRSKRELHQ